MPFQRQDFRFQLVHEPDAVPALILVLPFVPLCVWQLVLFRHFRSIPSTRDIQDNSHFCQLQNQCRTAIAEERQTDTGIWNQVADNADVNKCLQADVHGKANGQQHSKLVMCMACNIESTYQQQNEQQNNRQRTNKTQFFANNGKYKVVFRFRQVQIFCRDSPRPKPNNPPEPMAIKD